MTDISTSNTTSFESYGLSEPLLKAIRDLNFEKPSEIQSQTIPLMLKGHHVIGLAQTGTGKTAAFALPLLQKLDAATRGTQILILTPTRELAIQVGDQIEKLGKYLKATEISILCGGQEYRKQLKQLKDGAKIVVGTPGRVLDHIRRKSLRLDEVSSFILDEADEMLRMGFIEDVETVLKALSDNVQLALFSATMPAPIRKIANNYLKDAITVEIRKETATVKSIHQKFLFASNKEKPAAMLRVLAIEETQGVIIFMRTKTATEDMSQYLQQYGYRAMALHGDVSQSIRERITSQFRQGLIDVLVATDVAARGLDVERVSHVINYDVPFDCETYVHRIGRTGRAGRSGISILFITPSESRTLQRIEKHTRQQIEKMQIPNDEQILQASKKQLFEKISKRLEHKAQGDYQSLLQEFMEQSDASPLEVASALAIYLHKDEDWSKTIKLPSASAPKEDRNHNRQDRQSRFDSPRQSRFESSKKGKVRKVQFEDKGPQEVFRLDVGKMHGVKPANIIGAIANESGIQGKHISGLKIYQKYSTVQLPKDLPKDLFQDITKIWVCGRQLNISRVKS